jgi:hypothetical protein
LAEPKAGENAGPAIPPQADALRQLHGGEGAGFRASASGAQDLPMDGAVGGRGSYIQLYGTEGLYVVEIRRRAESMPSGSV